MRRITSAGALLVALLAAPVLALAQGPVLSFDQLNTRLRLRLSLAPVLAPRARGVALSLSF